MADELKGRKARAGPSSGSDGDPQIPYNRDIAQFEQMKRVRGRVESDRINLPHRLAIDHQIEGPDLTRHRIIPLEVQLHGKPWRVLRRLRRTGAQLDLHIARKPARCQP